MTIANHSSQRPRVLLLAYACSPGHGSEPGVGWNRAVETATFCDTWVICEQREFAESIRRHLQTQGEIPGLQFEFVPLMGWERFLGIIPGMGYLGYKSWHWRAFRAARRLHEQIRFDLVHQLTYCGFREPGLLWKLPVPFVWGPVGGTQNYPWRFLCQASICEGLSEALRSLVNRLQLRFSPRVRRASRKAAALLTANSTNQRDFARVQRLTPTLVSDVGLARVAGKSCAHRTDAHNLRILWSGQLCPRKALPLLLNALARLPEVVAYELRILGDGPLKHRWQRLANRTGVKAHTTWMGWLPHQEALQQYAWADVFVFTSLRDTTGTVVVEALGAGLPVVCLDHQGVHDVVTDQCGIKIPVTTPREVVDGLAEAITSLARDTHVRNRLSQGALKRAEQYLWSRQGERMALIYQRVLGDRPGGVKESTCAPQQAPAQAYGSSGSECSPRAEIGT